LRYWLHRAGLRALSTRPQRPRTKVADPAAVVAENRLLGQPAPTAPDQVWVGDITYLPLVGGRWCYLTTWRDACSRRVVSWHLAAQMPTELVLHALEQTLTLRQPAAGLIVHADRGSQYTSAACRARTEQAKGVPSFSRSGNPYDNAQAEARSKPNYCPAVAPLLRWKKPVWKSLTTSTPTSTSTATPPSATVRPTNLNRT
jgi:putative transposase